MTMTRNAATRAASPPAMTPDTDRTAEALTAQRNWIALLRGELAPEALVSLSGAQWTLLADEARRHRLSPATYHILSQDPVRHSTPPAVLDRLRPAYVNTALHNAVFFRHTSRMAAALVEHGIPVMLLKGMHLARFVYAQPAMRGMADIDIMVPRDRLAAAERIFVESGYGPLPRPNIDEFCTWSNHLAKLSKPGEPVFEIHWGIERPTSPFAIDIEGLWARSRTATLEGVPVHLLSFEDLLLHLALHSSYHHRFDRSAFQGLVDIHTVIVRHGEEIDWLTLADRAVEWKAAGFLYATLRLVREVLGAPIPADTLQALPREPEDERVIEVARRYILMPGQQLPPVYVKLAHSRSPRERFTLLLLNLFLPRSTMERVYGLPPGARWLLPYYVHRLGHLLVKRGSLSLRALFRTEAMRAPIDREDQRLRIERWVKDLPGRGGTKSG